MFLPDASYVLLKLGWRPETRPRYLSRIPGSDIVVTRAAIAELFFRSLRRASIGDAPANETLSPSFSLIDHRYILARISTKLSLDRAHANTPLSKKSVAPSLRTGMVACTPSTGEHLPANENSTLLRSNDQPSPLFRVQRNERKIGREHYLTHWYRGKSSNTVQTSQHLGFVTTTTTVAYPR